MARLLFKGETIQVKVTHNVLSEMIRLTNISYSELSDLINKDPMGWIRDILYCSLKVYDPSKLGTMSQYDVGDVLFSLSNEVRLQFLKELTEDLVKSVSSNGTQEVNSADTVK
jgi:hypothetical protein